jgi:putative monooxygenase
MQEVNIVTGVKVINIKDVAGERKDPPRTSWILISEKTVGAKNLAMGINETEPESMVPEHVHQSEEEVMFFLSGKGEFITDGEVIPIEAGTAIYNPPGRPHKIINTGNETLKFVWIYSPQLPAHRKSE